MHAKKSIYQKPSAKILFAGNFVTVDVSVNGCVYWEFDICLWETIFVLSILIADKR